MEVLIHIGDAKCGSSSIQASLYSYRETLLDHGVIYHPASTSNGHYSYITLLGGRTRGDDTNQAEMARKNLRETSDLVSKHNPRYLILSAENFFGVNPALISNLIDDALGFLTKKHVISFLRHPVDLYLSTVQQQLKADHKFSAPETFKRDLVRPFKLWAAQKDLESVSVRLFSANHMKDKSVIAEFNSVLSKITNDESINLPDMRANTSLSAEQMIVLQDFRKDFLSERSGFFDPKSSKIVDLFNKLNEINKNVIGTKPELLDAVSACIMSKNSENIAAAEKAFPGIGLQNLHPRPDTGSDSNKVDWSSDVRSIIKKYDPKILDAFKQLIPQYNPQISSGDRSKTLLNLVNLSSSPQAKIAYEKYLDWANVPNPKYTSKGRPC